MTHDQLRTLAARCIGRRNDYALQQGDGRYLRQHQPLSWDLLRAHLVGDLTLGTYLIDAWGLCRFAVFDADESDGLVALIEVQDRLAAAGIASVLEGSRRGGHLWVFLASPASPLLVRAWLLPFCPVGIEFYPKQDGATWPQPGSLIRVPLGVHRRSGRRYPFLHQVGGQLVPVARSVGETLAWLAGVELVELPALPDLSVRDQGASHKPHTYVAKNVLVAPLAPSITIHTWCASQESVAVISHYVELNGCGLGCCPFGEHHANGRDVHPSLWVHEPRGPGAPCWYCHTWGRGGNLFDFLRLYTGLDTRSLWARIRAGESF